MFIKDDEVQTCEDVVEKIAQKRYTLDLLSNGIRKAEHAGECAERHHLRVRQVVGETEVLRSKFYENCPTCETKLTDKCPRKVV